MRTLCVRLDSIGDVLVTGPAIRAVAARWYPVTLLAGPSGAEAARLLPGVDEVIEWHCPWISRDAPPVTPERVDALVGYLADMGFDQALIFTSYHQSPLPTALLLRLGGVPWIGAICEDYPGSLLDLRHQVNNDIPEPERAVSLCRAAGMPPAEGDDGQLRLRTPLPDVSHLVPSRPYVVLHPGTSVPARAWPVERFAEAARLLAAEGRRVVVTGTADETPLTRRVAGTWATDLGGRTDLAHLAGVIARAQALVVANTGPAHLAAAVGTPVVSLFAPTVPAVRWAPYRVRHVLLGDQTAACRDSRAANCPIPGHPCLSSVTAEEAVRAVDKLTDQGVVRRS
ncbi:MAG TPA: glycosyltransferase family 9 protein [Micromonosporaceae bacterium]